MPRKTHKQPGLHAASVNPWGRAPRTWPLLGVGIVICALALVARLYFLPGWLEEIPERGLVWAQNTSQHARELLRADYREAVPVAESTKPALVEATQSASVKPARTKPVTGLAAWCEDLAARLASVSLRHCSNRGFVDTGYRSVEGRPIAVRAVQANAGSTQGRVLLIGGTHGDELTSVSLTFWWLELLEEQSRSIDWRVAPAMNPDGVLSRPARRMNARGIDLNRNMPTPDWHDRSRAYWQEVDYQERRYPGKRAASEPETQWLVSEIERFRPDVIIALHAPYGVLDYDGEFPPPARLGNLGLQRLGVFPGSLGNYGARHLGIPVMTVELDHATRMPSRKRARAMFQDLNRWLGRYLASPQKQVQSQAGSNSG